MIVLNKFVQVFISTEFERHRCFGKMGQKENEYRYYSKNVIVNDLFYLSIIVNSLIS